MERKIMKSKIGNLEIFGVKVPKVLLRYLAMEFLDFKSICKLVKVTGFNIFTSENMDFFHKVQKGLLWNSSHGHLDVIKYLVKNTENFTFDSIYVLKAASMGHVDIIKYFHDYICESNFFWLAMTAATCGRLNIISYIFKFLENLTHPLEIAAKFGHLDIVKFFHVQNVPIHSAFLEAAEHGQLEVVKYLIESGFEVSQKVLNEIKNTKILSYLEKKNIK